MSLLANAKKWEQSYLPSEEQMSLHVDAEEFFRRLMHDTFFSEKIDSLAVAIHKKYLEINEHNNNIAAEFLRNWDDLAEELKELARDQARRIPEALLEINYDVLSVKETPAVIEFTEKELDMLFAYEHTRWCRYQKRAGWKKGNIMDIGAKTDPALVNWNSLPKENKKSLYQMVTVWPEILAQSNFKIERLKFLNDCETPR
jgi:hypothetical protein